MCVSLACIHWQQREGATGQYTHSMLAACKPSKPDRSTPGHGFYMNIVNAMRLHK